jgi:DNA-binding PadR family transcriptional regulator
LGRKRFSAEYTMLVVLEYLALTSREKPVTKYHIMTHISELKQQRQDRISQFVDTLERNGFITLIDTANAKFYYITENGLMEYNRWVRNFLAFFRGINNLEYEEDNVIKNIIQKDIFI